MTSTRSKYSRPASMSSSSFWAFTRPWTTAIRRARSPTGNVTARMVSLPRMPENSMAWRVFLDLSSTTRRATASATPPVVPKITAAPVPMPKGISGDSPSSSANRMPDSLIMVMISWVVSTRSTSGFPSCWNSGRLASIFLAVQGMTAM